MCVILQQETLVDADCGSVDRKVSFSMPGETVVESDGRVRRRAVFGDEDEDAEESGDDDDDDDAASEDEEDEEEVSNSTYLPHSTRVIVCHF